MAFTVSPSVIVREVDASATVPAIATPPGAIAGVFRWGPVNEPILITSEDNLVSRFGTPDDSNFETFFTAADFLAYANPIFVTRADNGATVADSRDDVFFTAETAYANTAAPGYVEGTTPGSIGTLDAANTTFGAFEAKYKGEMGNSIEVAYAKGSDFEATLITTGEALAVDLADSSNTQPELAFNSTSIQIQVLAANRIAPGSVAVNDVVVIGSDSAGYQELEVSGYSETLLDGNGVALVDQSNTAAATAFEYDFDFTGRYTIAESLPGKINITRKWKYSNLFGKAADASAYHIAVVDSDGGISGAAGTVLEVYNNLSTTAGAQLGDGTDNYYHTVIENQSSWIKVSNTVHFEAKTSEYESFSGAVAGTTESTVTLSAMGAAWDTFKNANELDVSFVLQGKGDNAGNFANYIISNIADYRKDCVAYISPSKEASVDSTTTNSKMTAVIAYRNKLQSSSYMFMDSGYKYRYDKYNDVYRWVPLNGDTAGLSSRVESWESPAGFRKGVIKNVVKLAFNPDKAQRDQLYAKDVNPVISQVGQGIVLFGDKTGLGANSAFDRLNVRRLFIAVEKAIATAAQSFLFELNDEFTQTQFKNAVDPFLRDIQGRRGIIDFRIVSDESINTPTVIDQNKFRANIFIKPARSINVIELTFVATRSGVEFDEIVGQLT
jgi:hypothetical protein